MSKKSGFDFKSLMNQNSINEIDSDLYKVEYIHIKDLQSSKKNFYSTKNVEGLKRLIEFAGLQQNLVVCKKGEVYEILSGHRRYTACNMLYSEGNEKFEKIPCRVVQTDDVLSDEMQLLIGNCENRVISEYEKMYEVIRYTELLKQLKKEGHKIEGRTRKIIADELDMATGQVGRYQSIYNNLIPELMEEFRNEKLNLTTADALSSLTDEQQKTYFDRIVSGEKITATIVREESKKKIESVESEKNVSIMGTKKISAVDDGWNFKEQLELDEQGDIVDSTIEKSETIEPIIEKSDIKELDIEKNVPIMDTKLEEKAEIEVNEVVQKEVIAEIITEDKTESFSLLDKSETDIVGDVSKKYTSKLDEVNTRINKHIETGTTPNNLDLEAQLELQVISEALQLFNQLKINPMVFMPNEYTHTFWKNENGKRVKFVGVRLEVKNIVFFTTDNGYDINNFIFTEENSGIAVNYNIIEKYKTDNSNELENKLNSKMEQLGYKHISELKEDRI